MQRIPHLMLKIDWQKRYLKKHNCIRAYIKYKYIKLMKYNPYLDDFKKREKCS